MEIEQDNNIRYKKMEKIGEGTYGSVVLVFDHQLNKTIAVKKIKMTQQSQGIPINALRQIAALKTFDHPNIIKQAQMQKRFLSANYNSQQKKMYISLQYINETLYDHYLKKNLSPYSIKSYVYQILKGLQYLELKGFMHRDLKPQNIMVNEKGSIKLIDFGQIKYFNYPPQKNLHTTSVSTLWYKAPELVLGAEQYNQKIDVWSLGYRIHIMINIMLFYQIFCHIKSNIRLLQLLLFYFLKFCLFRKFLKIPKNCILFQLTLRKPLFESTSQIDHIFKILKTFGNPKLTNFPQLKNWKYMSPFFPKFECKELKIVQLCEEGNDLLNKMLKIDPSQRISVSRALKHSYFQGFD